MPPKPRTADQMLPARQPRHREARMQIRFYKPPWYQQHPPNPKPQLPEASPSMQKQHQVSLANRQWRHPRQQLHRRSSRNRKQHQQQQTMQANPLAHAHKHLCKLQPKLPRHCSRSPQYFTNNALLAASPPRQQHHWPRHQWKKPGRQLTRQQQQFSKRHLAALTNRRQ